jgi:hypothetical protein
MLQLPVLRMILLFCLMCGFYISVHSVHCYIKHDNFVFHREPSVEHIETLNMSQGRNTSPQLVCMSNNIGEFGSCLF